MRRSFALIACVVAALVAAGMESPAPGQDVPQGLARDGVPTLAPVVKRVRPAVVNIAVTSQAPGQENPLLQDPFFRHFFGLPETPSPRQGSSVGSGVIVDAKNGYVMTNHHVIANATDIVVTLKDRRRFEAKRVGSDAATDIALLKIEPKDLTAVTLGNSDRLQVGDFVLAIGNPFGLGQTVTSGIVSALGRRGLNIEGYEDFIQTDASINPGNSGGALIDLRGQLVGINTAIIGPAGANVGIGFAVPSNIARSVMDQLVKHGEVRRGRLGIAIQDLTPDIAEALGLDRTDGAVITAVESGSPAQRAGLRSGDVIVAVDGRPVRGGGGLRNRVGLTALGTSVALTLYRDRRRIDITVRIEAQNATAAGQESQASPLAGAILNEIRSDPSSPAGLAGVLVREVVTGSPAEKHGLRPGDRIVGFNRYPVRSLDGLNKLLSGSTGAVALTIIRNRQRRLVIIK